MDLDRGKNRTVQVFSLDDGWLREKCEGKVIQFIDKDWQKNFKINRLVSEMCSIDGSRIYINLKLKRSQHPAV